MPVRYITPAGAGTRDGTSWENAGTLNNLNGFIAAAGPGGEVLLRADAGSYSVGGVDFKTINHGGAAGAPVTIRGVDGAGVAMKAELVGPRADPWLPGLQKGGQEIFSLQAGADHLVFESLAFENIGNGAFRIGADIADLTLQDIVADNVQRFLENSAVVSGSTASVDGLTVRDVEVHGYSRAAFHLRYDSRNILIENVLGDSEGQDGDNFAMGVHLDGTVHAVVLRHVEMLNNHDSVNSYWNGDGFATERGVYDVLFEDTYAAGNTDGGYDLKSSDTHLVRAVAEDNKRNFRLWSDGIALDDSTSLDPHIRGGIGLQSHIWVADGAHPLVRNSIVSDDDAATIAFDVSDGGHSSLTLVDSAITRAPDGGFMRLAAGSSLVVDGFLYGADSGSDSKDSLVGSSNSDTLRGLGGDDLLDGRGGPDLLVGGAGSDWAFYDSSPGPVTIDLSAGTGAGADAQGDRLAEIENVESSKFADVLVGNDAANHFLGGAGNDLLSGLGGADLLDGGLGADTMQGGLGDDLYVVDDAADVVAEAVGQGRDAVRTSLASYKLPDNVEELSVLGAAAFVAVGNALPNVIAGGGGGDSIDGRDGGDSIAGGAGRDRILGSAGEDTVSGGDGDDDILGGWQNDRLSGDGGSDRIFGDSESFSGSSRGANDWIHGGDGADFLYGDARIISSGGRGGNDTIRTGAGDDVAYGDAENLTGTAGADRLYGEAGNDWLYGDSLNLAGAIGGDDTLDGGAGDDRLFGGGGNDLFVFERQENGTDRLMDFVAGGGEDRVKLVGSSLKTFAAVQAALSTDPETGDAVLRYDGGEVHFVGIGITQLTATDFLFG